MCKHNKCSVFKKYIIFYFLFINIEAFADKMRYYEMQQPEYFPHDLKGAVLEQHPWREGYLDVTKPPFNAVGNGIHDDTTAIQKAVDYAYANMFAVYFPGNRTYLVSGTINCHQWAGDYYLNGEYVRANAQRKWANQLVGDKSRASRPVIRLKDGSAGLTDGVLFDFRNFDDALNEDPANQFNSVFRGIDIDMGNNPDAKAIRMDGAQNCVIEDTSIFGDAFYSGIFRIPGSSGAISNLSVTGGDYGIYQDRYRPVPLMLGLTLKNQNLAGVYIRNSRGPVIIGGFSITHDNPAQNYRAIWSKNALLNDPEDYSHGNMVLMDGKIDLANNGQSDVRAIENYFSDMTIHNTYIKAPELLRMGSRAYAGRQPVVLQQQAEDRWHRIEHYLFANGYHNASIKTPAFSNGVTGEHASYFYSPVEVLPENELPPPGLLNRHCLPEVSWPHWQMEDLVDVVLDYAATSDDGSDDDALAIQQAIDETTDPDSPHFGKTVFIPRGFFHLRSRLVLKAGTRLIGGGNHLSILEAHADFPAVQNHAVLIDSEDADGYCLISDIAVVGRAGIPSSPTLGKLTHIRYRLSKTVVRNLCHELRTDYYDTPLMEKPLVIVEGHGGGKFYTTSLDLGPRNKDPQYADSFRALLIKNTFNPLNFYLIDPEYFRNHRGQIQIIFSSNVNFIGFKYEDHGRLLEINHSSNISIIGGGGNYTLTDPADTAIILISGNCDNLYFSQLARKFNRNSNDPGFFIKYNTERLDYNAELHTWQYGSCHLNEFGEDFPFTNAEYDGNYFKVEGPWYLQGGEAASLGLSSFSPEEAIVRIELKSGASVIASVQIDVPAGENDLTVPLVVPLPSGGDIQDDLVLYSRMWDQDWQYEAHNLSTDLVIYDPGIVSTLYALSHNPVSPAVKGQLVENQVDFCSADNSVIECLFSNASGTWEESRTIATSAGAKGSHTFFCEVPSGYQDQVLYTTVRFWNENMSSMHMDQLTGEIPVIENAISTYEVFTDELFTDARVWPSTCTLAVVPSTDGSGNMLQFDYDFMSHKASLVLDDIQAGAVKVVNEQSVLKFSHRETDPSLTVKLLLQDSYGNEAALRIPNATSFESVAIPFSAFDAISPSSLKNIQFIISGAQSAQGTLLLDDVCIE